MNEIFYSRHDDRLGAFIHETLTTHVNLTDQEIQATIAWFEPGAPSIKTSATNADVEAALKAMTLCHEVRHLYDCFGTIAGISLFDASMQLLAEFASVCRDLATRHQKWHLPLSSWLSDHRCPASVKQFARHARGLTMAAEQFLASYEPITTTGHREEVYVFVPDEYGGASIPAFPVTLGLQTPGKPELLRTVLYPIGFKALVEGNARAVERSIIESSFNSELANSILQKKWTVLSPASSPIEPSDMILPYDITDLLVSKYCVGRIFPRDVILALADMTLSSTAILRLENSALQVDVVGRTFLDQLRSFSADEISRGEVRHPDHLTAAYENVLRSFESGPTVEDMIKPAVSLIELIELFKTFAVRRIVVPLIKYRIATHHAAFATATGFVESLQTIGPPPFIASRDNLHRHDVPDEIFDARGAVIMVSALMRQIIADREVILCPRAHALTPGLDVEEFAVEGSCSEFASVGTCGSWHLGRQMKLPQCLFRNALEVSRVDADSR